MRDSSARVGKLPSRGHKVSFCEMILMGFPAVPLRRELVEDDDMSAIAARRCGGYPRSALSNQARVLWILLVSRRAVLGSHCVRLLV